MIILLLGETLKLPKILITFNCKLIVSHLTVKSESQSQEFKLGDILTTCDISRVTVSRVPGIVIVLRWRFNVVDQASRSTKNFENLYQK